MNHTTLRGLIAGTPGMPIPVIQTEGGKWSASRPLTDEEAAWMRTHKDRADIDILNYEDKPCCRLVNEKLDAASYVTATYPRMILSNVEIKTKFWRNSWGGGKCEIIPNLLPVTITTPIGNGKFKFQEISQEEFVARCQTLEDGTLYYIPPKEPTNMNQDQDVQPHWPPLPVEPFSTERNRDSARSQFVTEVLALTTAPGVEPQPRDFEQELMREAIDMVLVIIGKNRDYGSCIGESPVLCPHLDPGIAIDVRLSDKISRLESLMNHRGEANVKDESIEDTKLDMAAYVLLQRVVRKMQPQQGQSCPPQSNATSAEKT